MFIKQSVFVMFLGKVIFVWVFLRCYGHLKTHLEDSILSRLPENYQSELKQSIISEESDMSKYSFSLQLVYYSSPFHKYLDFCVVWFFNDLRLYLS